jgi:ABC-type sulfate transport system substrate-binding protein
MFATITLAGTVTAQGPVVEAHADGRVTIADGLRRLTGWPVARALRAPLTALAVALMALGAAPVQAESLLNVSYDPTRELYRELNEAFAAFWVAQGNPAPTIEASHGGSGPRPAR